MLSSVLRRSKKSRKDRAEEGFTLLEFLAAFTILVLFLASCLMAIAVAMRSDQQAAFLTLGSILAKSKLAAAGVDFPLQPGVASGQFANGYSWRAEVRNLSTISLDDERQVAGHWVEVTVSDPRFGARTLSLASIEISRGRSR